jgi:Family of unknown function (DUF5677)
MNEPEQPNVGSPNSIANNISLLEKLVVLLDRLVFILPRQGMLGIAVTIYINAVRESARSLILLIENDKFRDAYVVGRTIFFAALNACFSCSEGTSSAERAWRYAEQKLLRDQKRKVKIADLEMIIDAYVPSEIEEDAQMKEAIQEFSGRKGQERRSWTDETVDLQIVAIRAKYGPAIGKMFLLTRALVYRPASEIAHGTLYGSVWADGITVPYNNRPREKTIASKQFNVDVLLYSICECICAAIQILGKEFEPCTPFESESKVIRDELSLWITEMARRARLASNDEAKA